MTLNTHHLTANELMDFDYDFDALAIVAARLETYHESMSNPQTNTQDAKDNTGDLFANITGDNGNNNLTGTSRDDVINA